MKSNLLFGSILAAALSVGVGAQAPTGAPQDPTSPRPSNDQAMSKSSSSDAITVTGCVQADSAAATGTRVVPPARLRPSRRAHPGQRLGSIGRRRSGDGRNDPGPVRPRASTKLSGESNDLKKYVNSQVEIKGKVDSASAGAAAGGSSGPTLRVDSVKQVSPSCSQ